MQIKSSLKEMKLIGIVIICLSILLMPKCCDAMQIQEHSISHKEAQVEVRLYPPVHTLPRKLRILFEEAVKSQGVQVSTSNNKQKGDISGKPYQKEQNVLNGRRGTWHEWVEGTDTSQFFTMDYSHVKRRRPIHNKSLPVGP